MGLDMYLAADKYVSGYDFNEPEEIAEYQQALKLFGVDENFKSKSPGAHIKITVAYWHKANQIHKWFVDNIQDGKDECKEAYVEHDKLDELVRLCEEVLADHSKATELLPTQSGFFFGSIDYNNYYFKDLEYTIAQVKPLLTDERFADCEFRYRSSW